MASARASESWANKTTRCPYTRMIALVPRSFWIAFACLCAAAGTEGATYRIVDYPALQNGWRLSGVIELDDSAPIEQPLGFGAIESVLLSLVTPEEESVSADPVPSGVSLGAGALLATDGQLLTLTTRAELSGDPDAFFALTGVDDAQTPSLVVSVVYQRPANGEQGIYRAASGQVLAWDSSPSNIGLGGDPWVIAVRIPEPSSSVLMVVIFGAAAARHRR